MSDAESLEIKKRARRRLVGAVALALLAAVLLPLMMEQEPHSGSGDIQISIPPRPGLPVASQPEVPPPLPPAGEDGGPGELADPVTSQPGRSATEFDAGCAETSSTGRDSCGPRRCACHRTGRST